MVRGSNVAGASFTGNLGWVLIKQDDISSVISCAHIWVHNWLQRSILPCSGSLMLRDSVTDAKGIDVWSSMIHEDFEKLRRCYRSCMICGLAMRLLCKVRTLWRIVMSGGMASVVAADWTGRAQDRVSGENQKSGGEVIIKLRLTWPSWISSSRP